MDSEKKPGGLEEIKERVRNIYVFFYLEGNR
jgi:hypothetical protein